MGRRKVECLSQHRKRPFGLPSAFPLIHQTIHHQLGSASSGYFLLDAERHTSIVRTGL